MGHSNSNPEGPSHPYIVSLDDSTQPVVQASERCFRTGRILEDDNKFNLQRKNFKFNHVWRICRHLGSKSPLEGPSVHQSPNWIWPS